MKNPLVSVIVPVYNVEPYIEACLDSILGQSYKNLQILLIDDGSTDRSGEICDAYARKDTRVEVIHNINHGVSYSRNCGLDAAKGEYIAFADSDDTVSEKYIEKMVNMAIGKEAELVVCGINDVYKEGNLWRMPVAKIGGVQ